MKYLYVLVNSTTGFYIEQTYVSMLSLRHVTPDAFISLLVDDKTANIQDNKFLELIKSLVDEYKVISLPSNMPAIAKSRFIKTSMRKYISGDFLFIDSDTIWASPVDEKDFTFDIMGVLDGNDTLQNNPAFDYVQSVFKKTNYFPKSEYYFNSGVLFVRDSIFSHKFFEKWHKYWKESSKKECYVDQPSLNKLIEEELDSQRCLLPGSYNAQITFSLDYFFNAKIIHYFTYSIEYGETFKQPYVLKNKEFWQNISDKGINENLQKIINNPMAAFSKGCKIIAQEEESFKHTHLYGFVKDLYIKKLYGQKSRFDFYEKLIRLFQNR